jgi:hypothetical protein
MSQWGCTHTLSAEIKIAGNHLGSNSSFTDIMMKREKSVNP